MKEGVRILFENKNIQVHLGTVDSHYQRALDMYESNPGQYDILSCKDKNEVSSSLSSVAYSLAMQVLAKQGLSTNCTFPKDYQLERLYSEFYNETKKAQEIKDMMLLGSLKRLGYNKAVYVLDQDFELFLVSNGFISFNYMLELAVYKPYEPDKEDLIVYNTMTVSPLELCLINKLTRCYENSHLFLNSNREDILSFIKGRSQMKSEMMSNLNHKIATKNITQPKYDLKRRTEPLRPGDFYLLSSKKKVKDVQFSRDDYCYVTKDSISFRDTYEFDILSNLYKSLVCPNNSESRRFFEFTYGANMQSKLCQSMKYMDRRDYVILDTETSGLNTLFNEIIEFACLVIRNGEVSETIDILIKPTNPISREIEELTGITNEMLDTEGISQEEAREIINRVLSENKVLLAYNTTFDVLTLSTFLSRPVYLDNVCLDIMDLVNRIYPTLPKYKLGYVSELLGIEGINSHRAIDDVILTNNLFTYLRDTYRELFKIETVDVDANYFYNLRDTLKNIMFNNDKVALINLLSESFGIDKRITRMIEREGFGASQILHFLIYQLESLELYRPMAGTIFDLKKNKYNAIAVDMRDTLKPEHEYIAKYRANTIYM